MNTNLEELRNQKEREAIHTRKMHLWMYDVVLVAVQVLYRAAAAGNVQCIEGVKQIEKLWKEKPKQ